MDNKQFITLVITALLAAFMKEFFGWLLRSSSHVVRTILAAIRSRVAPVLLNHWRTLSIIFDCVMMGLTAFLVLKFTFNSQPLTKVLVFFIAVHTSLFYYWFRELRADIMELIRTRYRPNA